MNNAPQQSHEEIDSAPEDGSYDEWGDRSNYQVINGWSVVALILTVLSSFALVLPIFLLWRGSRNGGADHISPFIAPLSLMLAVNVADLIPNATLTPLTWLLAGALTGYAERMKSMRRLARTTSRRELEWQSIM